MGQHDRQRPVPSTDFATHRPGDFQQCPCGPDRAMRLEAVRRTAEWRTHVGAALIVRVDAHSRRLDDELERT